MRKHDKTKKKIEQKHLHVMIEVGVTWCDIRAAWLRVLRLTGGRLMFCVQAAPPPPLSLSLFSFHSL